MSDPSRSSENRDRPGRDFQTAMVPRFVAAGAVPILNLQRVARSVGPELYRAVLVCRYGSCDRTDA